MNMRRLVPLILKYAVLTGALIALLGPIWMLFVSSFRQTAGILSYPPVLWPGDGNLNNFKQVFTMQNHVFGRWFLNSLIVSGGNTVIVLILSSMAGFAFAKRTFPLKNTLFAIVIATQMIPAVATLIPLFLLISGFSMNNQYSGLILPGAASAFGVFLMTQFMRDIPDAIIEAAEIDGANPYSIFIRIIAPITVPTMSLLAIFNFTQQWGSLTWPLIIVSRGAMRTLPLGIASMKDLSGSVSGPIMAATLLSFIPVLIAFLCAREKFIAGMTLGAVKG
ncbi:MAG: carbohydrate ABC transporter permease [Treponema sp.]|jgi:multiple sugar transport system permease protein|nr:carbohydrate ABC transporter permease [Treponema sp.]